MLLTYVVALFAASAFLQGQSPEPRERDRILYARLNEFLEGKLTSDQLEVELRRYGQDFAVQPYRVKSAPIDWQKVPQDRLMRFVELIGRIIAPPQQAFFRGELTATEAAKAVAPFFLLWRGYGMDPPPDADALWHQRADELLRLISEYAAP
jgi:hypothetical protein